MPIPSPAKMKAMLQIAKERNIVTGNERKANLNKFLEPSKVKQRVYHGTGHDINEVKPNQFFAFNPNHANSYAEYAPDRGGRGENPNVMPAHVRATNPAGVRDVEEAVRDLGFLKPNDVYDDPTTHEWLTENQFQNAPLVIEELKKRGFDSALIPDMDLYDNDIKSLQVFDPSNVKSAIGNQGTFDPNEPDITKADGGAVHMAGGGDAIGMAIQMAKKLPRKVVAGNERQANLNKFLENSKVKEKMYRGATPHFQLQGEPIFVSPTVRFAEKFPVGSASPRIATNQNQTIYPLHVNATNPFDYENTDDIQKVIYEISKSDPEQAEKLKNEFKYYLDMGDKFGTQSGNWGLIENTLVQDAIKKLGYDSFYVNEENVKNLGVYDPSQVKTAIGNQGTFDPNDPDITKAKGGEVHMAGGGGDAIKTALKMAKKGTQNVLPKPTIIIPSKLSDVKEAVRKSKGEYGARRVERASDEIPNLEKMYQEEALRRAFAGDNAKALMTMNPKDFENYATPLKNTDVPFPYQTDGPMTFEEYITHLNNVGGFDDVPYLGLGSARNSSDWLANEKLLGIKSHEGRHRSRALANRGEDSSLVQLMPNYDLASDLPRRTQEEFIESLKDELQRNPNVVPQQSYSDRLENNIRMPLRLPDIYAEGGAVHMVKGGGMKNAIKMAKNLPPPENAQRTQIIGTLPTYEKAKMLFELSKAKGKGIDYGAGLGEGAKILKADTYEPYPKDWKPTFTNPEDIPDEAYGKLTNLNVLNVVPREIRDEMVLDMGRVMRPKSHGIITTRGADVMNAKGEKGPEPMSVITSRDTYQKGFDKNELIDYLRYMLGDDFDIDKLNLGPAGAMVQKKAGGGEVHMSKGGAEAIKQAVKQARKAPMIMKKVSASEPELQARIREMKAKGQIYESDKPVTPEFIRPDPEKSTNPAGYSRKQWEKNQQYQSTIRPTHEFSEPEIINPEDVEGRPAVIVPGDRTIGGAEIVDVNGLPLTNPAKMYAGPSYGQEMADKGIDEFWASQLNAATGVQNKAKHAYEETGEIPLGIYSAMGPETGNYSIHNTDVALNLINARNPSRSQLKAFEDLMKQGYFDPTKKKQITFDKFSFDDMDELKSNLSANPEMRKFFINRLEKPTISEALDMPSGLEIRHAITEPRLRDVPTGTTGFSIGSLMPEKDVHPNIFHPTYDTSIPGNYMGRMELQLPWEEYFPTNYANIMSDPKQAKSAFGTMQGLKTYETFTPELVDRLMKMKELIKTGRFKKGGAVGMKEGGKGTVSIEGVTYQPDPIYTDPMGATVPLSINENESIYQPILKDDQMRLELANKPKPIATPISFGKEPYRDPLTGILVDDPLSALPPGANVKPSTKYPQITPFPTSLEPPKNTMTAAGVLEPLATLGSGMLSFFPALPYAFGKSVLTNSDFPTNFNEAMSVGTRIPRSEEGLANLESIGDMLDKVSKEYKLAPIMPELHGFEPILTAGALRGARAGARGATDLTKALGEKAYLSTENMLRNQGLMPSVVPQGQTTIAPISPKDDFGFYSKLERSALNLQRKQGNGQAFINELKSKGATPEELDMSGLKEFLATKPNFTKQEVQDYVQSHRPKLNEKVLVDRPALDSMINEKLKTFGYTVEDTIEGATGEPSYIFYDKNGNDVDYEDLPSDVQNFISENFSSNTIPSAKYADMKGTRTPGGENYREVLITYPKRAERGADGVERKNEIAKAIFGADSYDSLNYRQKESVLSRLRLESQVYNKGHFGDVADNVMAHLRLDNRTDVDGKKGTLVDELQSDIHQEGRESGYKKDYEENDEINQLLKKRGNEGLVANEVKQLDKLITNATLVPDAPYKDDWYKIGLKKAIQKAVENGDDRIYTPTGKDLIDRYESELRKNVDYINYEPFEEDGVKYYEISAGKNGEEVFSKEGVTEEELQKLLGKSIAKKIINNQGESAGTEYRPDWKMLVGDDLSIGGSGMIEYYDKRYPAYLKDFAKKYGGTVGETKIFLNKKYYLADMEGNLLDSAGWTKEKDAIEAGEWRNRGSDNQDWQVIQKKEVTEDDMKRMYGYSDEEWARVSPEQRRGMANTLNKDSLRKVYYYEPSEEAKKKIIGGLPYKEGGIVKMAGGGGVKKAAQMAIKTASQGKVGQLANKDLLTAQDFHTSLRDTIMSRAMEAQKQMDSWDYKYSPDQYVFTEHSASKNLPPLKILGRSRTGNNLMFEGEPWVSKKIIDPETGKAMRTPYEPGYKVRREHGDDWSEFTIPETAIKGLVEPDEPYRKGGAVHMQDGGLPIRAHNREFETPDLMNARDIGVTGDYEDKSLTLGKQQMRKDFDDATKMKREMDYIRYSQPFREGRISAMAMKDPSNPIYQGMLQYDQPMMGGNAGIGVMGMRTPEEDYKLKALQLMYQQRLGKDGNLSGFVGMPFGGKPMGGVQYRGRFAEGGIVDDYIQGFPMGSRFVQKKAPQPVAVQAKPTLDNFEHALGFVLPHEGGYNNRKGDSPTNYGIKQSVYSDYLGRPASVDDIKNMPMEHAKEIYRKQYWNPIEAHGLDLKPSVVAFDAAVNQGPTFARSMVGSTQGDIEKMLEARQQRYNEVIKNNPSKRRFKAGWDNRMNAVRNYAMEDYHAKGGKVSMDDMNIALLRNK